MWLFCSPLLLADQRSNCHWEPSTKGVFLHLENLRERFTGVLSKSGITAVIYPPEMEYIKADRHGRITILVPQGLDMLNKEDIDGIVQVDYHEEVGEWRIAYVNSAYIFDQVLQAASRGEEDINRHVEFATVWNGGGSVRGRTSRWMSKCKELVRQLDRTSICVEPSANLEIPYFQAKEAISSAWLGNKPRGYAWVPTWGEIRGNQLNESLDYQHEIQSLEGAVEDATTMRLTVTNFLTVAHHDSAKLYLTGRIRLYEESIKRDAAKLDSLKKAHPEFERNL